jgi:hypothetical protein
MLQYTKVMTAKRYFQDRFVLLLLSIDVFLAFLACLLILFRIGGAGNNGFIVQYRANLGISAFKTGGISSILSFIGFALLVLIFHVTLSWKTYHIKRQLSLTILALGVPLLLLCIIVSNALLVLR